MQVTSGLKKRSPFEFASDEDNLLEDTAFLDDQGEPRLLVLVYRRKLSTGQSDVAFQSRKKSSSF